MPDHSETFLDYCSRSWLRTLILLVVVSSVGYLLSQVGNIKLSADTRVYFNEDHENLVAFDKLEDDYSKDESVYIVIESADNKLFDRQNLLLIREMTEKAWLLDYVARVDSLSNYQYTQADGDDLLVEDLFGENLPDMAPDEIDQRRQFVLNQPELLSSIVSTDGRVTAISLSVTTPGENKAEEVPQVVAQVRGFVAEYAAANPQLSFHIGGQIMLNNAFAEISKADIKNLYPIMLLVILAMLYLFFRKIPPTLVTMVVVVLSCVGTLGVAGAAHMSLASIVINAPIMVMSLALADCVHILVNYYDYIDEGKSKLEAMKSSLRLNFKAVTLTTITTAIGFLSLNFSESPPFRDLGNLVAVGVLIAYVLSLTVLPILMVLLPTTARTSSDRAPQDFWGKLALLYRSKFITPTFILLLVVSAVSCWNLKIDDTSTDFFSLDTSFRQDAEYIEANLTGVSQINYSIAAGGANGVTSVEYLQLLDNMVAWLRSQPEVTYVSTVIDIIKRLNQNLHASEDEWYRIPTDSDMASQYLLLYELSLPLGLDLTNRINLDKSASRLIVNLTKSSATELLEFDRRFGTWLSNNAPDYMLTKAASPAMMFAYVSQSNTYSMILGVLVALVLISAILMAMLRSLRLGFISLLMNCTPILIAFGIWSLIVGEAGLGVSLVLGISLGIVVDNSIHFLSKYQHANRALQHDVAASIRYALRTVGKALVITTISVSAGFLVISSSDFSLNSDMGIMTSLAIAVALIVDLVFIPPILERLETR